MSSDYNPNQQGSASRPTSTDAPINADTQQALDNARKANALHDAANKLADKGRRK